MLPKELCVYLIESEGAFLYVGVSTNLKARVKQHWNIWLKNFESANIYWINHSSIFLAVEQEQYLIDELKPLRNKKIANLPTAGQFRRMLEGEAHREGRACYWFPPPWKPKRSNVAELFELRGVSND
jgi:predicted GIY-YIG superfamily endonuclease